MSAEQKYSWYMIGCFALALIVFAGLIPLIGIRAACGAIGLLGLTGLAPLLFRRKRKSGEVTTDERDGMISLKATMVTGIVTFEVVLLFCMIPWFIYMLQDKEVVSINMLPLVVLVAGITFMVTRAIAILVLYGRSSRGEKS